MQMTAHTRIPYHEVQFPQRFKCFLLKHYLMLYSLYLQIAICMHTYIKLNQTDVQTMSKLADTQWLPLSDLPLLTVYREISLVLIHFN